MSVLNPRAKSTPVLVTNPEGHEVFAEEPELELFKLASNLKAKDSFYRDEKERITNFLNSVDTVKDKEYVKSLAWFLNGLGLKLSPIVMTTHLNESLDAEDRKVLVKMWDRPDKVAISIGMEKHLNTELTPTFKKKVLKAALQNFGPLQLKKMRMENRAIKLKDLIKLLHPKPKDKQMAKLYKAIIESSKEAKLTSKDSFVAAKSDVKMSEEDKLKMMIDNVEKIPINMLVRNLRFYQKFQDYGDKRKFKTKVVKRLKDVINDNKERVFNPFDLITVAIEVPALQDEMLEVLQLFIMKVQERTEFELTGKTAVLFDISGSMGEGYEKIAGQTGQKEGFKYLMLFTLLFGLKDEDIWMFDTELKKPRKVVSLIRSGKLVEARKEFDVQGGTALVDSFRKLVDEHEYQNVVIISDEVTWADSDSVEALDERLRTGRYSSYSKEGKKREHINLIVINPVTYGPTVFRKKMLALACLDAKILYYLNILVNYKGFVKMIKEEYKNAQEFKESDKDISEDD